MSGHQARAPRGAALIIGFVLVILLLVMAMAFTTRMNANQLRTESDIAGERSYELAQTSNTLKIQQVWSAFKNKSADERIAWVGGEDANNNGKLDTGEDANINKKLDAAHAPDFQDANWVHGSAGDACTRIKVLSLLKNKWAIVRFTTWARVKDDLRDYNVVRKVQRVVRFSLQPASVFDFVYFATNEATLDGKKVIMYGPIGSNGNLNLVNNPIIDGKIFAGQNPELNSAGIVNGQTAHDSVAAYQSALSKNPLMRPTNPVAPSEDKNKSGYLDPGEDLNNNGMLDTFKYSLGYDGTQPVSTLQKPALMPSLGDLNIFREYSDSYVRPSRPELGETGGATGSVVKQLMQPGLDPTNPANYRVLIDRSYGDRGESGMRARVTDNGITYENLPHKIDNNPANGWKNGNVALIGTPEQPLIVLGPVVVTNDLVIKGTVTGQGTLYTGRNLHVAGDLVYKDPPQWKLNDINFDQTAALNKTKDAVGFGARGSIILGNYVDMDTGADQWAVAKKYMTPPATKPNLIVSLLDLLLGFGAQGTTFDGDYTKKDGDKMYLDNDNVPNTPNRAYYQSTFSKAYIKSIATKPTAMNGIFYANHLIGGRANGLQLFGSIIAHDEGIFSDNKATLIYDARISQLEPSTYVNLFLPGNAAMDVIYWKDIQADDAAASSPDW